MGQTTHGIPWPAGTELVRDGDNAMKALADKTDILIPIVLDIAAGTRTKVAMMVTSWNPTFDANGRATLNVSGTFVQVLYANLVNTTFPFSTSVVNGANPVIEFFAQFPNGSNVTGSATVQVLVIGILK